MSPEPSKLISQDKYRLPTNVKPSHYYLTLWTDLDSLQFGGLVTVDLDILQEASSIVLNCSDDLKLGDASVHCATLVAEEIQSAQIVADKELGRATLNFSAALPAGSKAQVKISYTAMLRGTMNGYYKSAWQKDGKTEYYALTQFQPTDARAAVPCWDEPQIKATWTITMISGAETVNISNMPAESEVAYDPTSAFDVNLATLLSTLPKKDAGWKITKFQETPPMSSYLVAFANGPFAYLETQIVMPLSGRTVPLRVYATPDIVHQGEFCLEVTAKVLPLYEKIFEIEYPLPKLDTLAVNDFDMVREQVREYYHYGDGSSDRFGVFPEWEVTSSFVIAHANRAMILDAKRSSHPIEVECPNPNFINQIFDGLSYSKAASGNVTRDLWDGMSTSSGEDIARLMNNWITKIGFPLITVSETSGGIHVRQDRYLDNGTPSMDENQTIWNVPLAILTVDEKGQVHIDKTAILEDREKAFVVNTNRTFKLNAGANGFYRVSYTPERLSKIAIEAAKEGSVFSLSDRIGLLYDVSELSKAGLTPVSGLLTLMEIWKNEPNRKSPFHCISIANLSALDLVWVLLGPLIQRLGYEFPEGESVDIAQLRKTVIMGAVVGRDERVTRELRGRFTDYIKTGDKTRIPSDIKKAIFTSAVRYGGREEFEALLKIIEDPVNVADKVAAMRAIGCTVDLGLIKELFSYILTKARDQDAVFFCLGLETNPLARPLLVTFFKDNYDTLSKRFATNSMLKYLVTACFRSLSTQEAHDDAEAFFRASSNIRESGKDTTRYSMALAQALETIRTRIAYIKRTHNDLSDWLTQWEQRSKFQIVQL
ncbi:leucyl aminopeptidase [Mycena haematopus]|nr:leucyl aminopeptidase [Mycena haematopus]